MSLLRHSKHYDLRISRLSGFSHQPLRFVQILWETQHNVGKASVMNARSSDSDAALEPSRSSSSIATLRSNVIASSNRKGPGDCRYPEKFFSFTPWIGPVQHLVARRNRSSRSNRSTAALGSTLQQFNGSAGLRLT